MVSLEPPFRHEAGNVRAQFQGDGHNLGRIGHLEVEARADAFAQFPHIPILDMAPVLAQVRGDAVGPGGLAGEGCAHRVRFAPAAAAIPRLAERRHVIDVYTQL